MKLVMGGVARVKAAGGDGYGSDQYNGDTVGGAGSVDSLCVQPVRGGGGDGGGGGDANASGRTPRQSVGRSSRHKYGGATGVRGMDVDPHALALSHAFWGGGYGRGAKGAGAATGAASYVFG
jgi:hypothetical protein